MGGTQQRTSSMAISSLSRVCSARSAASLARTSYADDRASARLVPSSCTRVRSNLDSNSSSRRRFLSSSGSRSMIKLSSFPVNGKNRQFHNQHYLSSYEEENNNCLLACDPSLSPATEESGSKAHFHKREAPARRWWRTEACLFLLKHTLSPLTDLQHSLGFCKLYCQTISDS